MTSRGRLAEAGNTLVLGAGLVGICLLALVVAVDAGNAFLQHRQLFAMADAAALAGAQAVDLQEYYTSGAHQGTRLDSAAVVERARRHIEREQQELNIPGLHIDAVRSDGGDLVVELSAPVQLAFMTLLEGDTIHVVSKARLDYRSVLPGED